MLLAHTRCTPQQVSDELQQVVEDEDEAARRGVWRDAVQYAWRECVVAEAADSFALGTPPSLLALLVQKHQRCRNVARAGEDDACSASVTQY